MHKEQRNCSAYFAGLMHEMDIQSAKACSLDVRSELRDFIQFIFCLPLVIPLPSFGQALDIIER